MAEQQNLKKLNFVPEYGTKGYNLATTVYGSAKEKLPASVKEQLTKVEEQMTEASAPLITKAQDKGAEILKIVDEKVDKVMESAGQVYEKNAAYLQSQLEKQKELHNKGLENYRAAKEQYLKKVEESVEFIKSNGVTGAARKAADDVLTRASEARKLPGVVAQQVHDAFERLLAFEPVKKMLSTTKPAVDAAYTKYIGIHDSLVATPQYKRAYDLSQAAIARAQETFVYRTAAQRLYPLVAKYADPALEQLTASPYYQAALEHVQPKIAAQ